MCLKYTHTHIHFSTLLPLTCSQADVPILAQPHGGEARLLHDEYRRHSGGPGRRRAAPTAFPLRRGLKQAFGLQGEACVRWGVRRREDGGGGGGVLDPQMSRMLSRGSGRGRLPGFPISVMGQHPSHSSSSVPSPSAVPEAACVPVSPASNFLPHVSLSIPPLSPTPPDCQALESSGINVSFDYRSWMGDVSRARRSPLMSWHTGWLVHR